MLPTVPELPEVETVRRGLEPIVSGAQVVASWGHSSAKFAQASEITGVEFESIARRGKYLIVALDDGRELVVHLGMTGQLTWVPEPADPPDGYVRAWWQTTAGGRLQLRDVRRFGRIAVVDAGDYRSMPTLHHLGPEPFDAQLSPEVFWASLKSTNRHVKTALLSQRPIAGVGNIYADEACWLAQVSPVSRRVTRAQARALLVAIREVLAAAIDHGGTTLRDYRTADGGHGENQFHLSCYGRSGQPCVRCGTSLRSRSVDARTTTWCPNCQPNR